MLVVEEEEDEDDACALLLFLAGVVVVVVVVPTLGETMMIPSFGGINSKLSMVTLLSFSSTIISQNLKGMKEGEGSCLLMPLSANRKTSTLFAVDIFCDPRSDMLEAKLRINTKIVLF